MGNVSVKPTKSKTGTISADDGSFTLRVKTGETITLSRVDLISTTVTVFDSKMTVVKMQEFENNLSEVLVLAYSN